MPLLPEFARNYLFDTYGDSPYYDLTAYTMPYDDAVIVEFILHDISNDPQAGWTIIAAAIREHARNNGYRAAGVTIYPDPDNENLDHVRPRAQIFGMRAINEINAELLSGWFNEMLQSDARLTYYGMRITLEEMAVGEVEAPDPTTTIFGMGNRHAALGSGKFLPKGWQNRGVSLHPGEHRDDLSDAQKAMLGVDCGIRAVLIAHSDDWTSGPLQAFLDRAANISSVLGLQNHMTIADFRQVLDHPALPEFHDYRIAVYAHPGRDPVIHIGPRWAWPAGQPFNTPDDHTLTVVHHQQHWYGVVNQTAFRSFAVPNRSSRIRTRCYSCLREIKSDVFPEHVCDNIVDIPCALCRVHFTSQDSYDEHVNQKNEYYDPCDVCSKSMFYGDGCYRDHRIYNCVDPTAAPTDLHGRPARVICENCTAWYISGTVHDCNRMVITCPDCRKKFSSKKLLKEHRCPLPRNTKFYVPVDTSARNVRWRSHWAYDFETYRDYPLEGDEHVYVHSVLSWAVQLIIPDVETARYLDDFEVAAQIANGVSQITDDVDLVRIMQVAADVHTTWPSIRIRGRGLDRFISVVENVLAGEHRDDHAWTPTLWAHNGSKFDVKFIFDYYVNGHGYDMAGETFHQTYGGAYEPTSKTDSLDARKWKPVKHEVAADKQVRITNVGSKILKFEICALRIVYRCSQAHHPGPLRTLPATFGLTDLDIAKGEFPYRRLHPDSFNLADPRAMCVTGLPPLNEYEVRYLSPKRRQQVAMWWIGEQKIRNARPEIIRSQYEEAGIDRTEVVRWYGNDPLDPLVDDYHNPYEEADFWFFEEAMWTYLDSDVHVLARVMEAYHRKAVELHADVWATLAAGDDRHGSLVSPLLCTTAPGWAKDMFTTWFMPGDLIYTLKKQEHAFVTSSLHGGRTDKRANYCEVTDERYEAGDRLVQVDVVSLYPAVQRCSTYNTHFPTGHGLWLSNFYREMSPEEGGHTVKWKEYVNGQMLAQKGAALIQLCKDRGRTGFVEVDVQSVSYSTHPILHHFGTGADESNFAEPRLMFSTFPIKRKVYALPELALALQYKQVIVTHLYEGLFFDRSDGKDGSPAVFDAYVDFFFKLKFKAENDGNEGLRALAKNLLNSLWGKLGQRSNPIKEWVSDRVRLDYLINMEARRDIEILSWLKRGKRFHFEWRWSTDEGNLSSTAPHLAAFVSMWGRVILWHKLLGPHGQRTLYYDTDSALIYMRPGDWPKLTPLMGNEVGQLGDELPKIIKSAGHNPAQFPNAYIREVVLLAPKTYAIRVVDRDSSMECFKVVCKGFQPSHNNSDVMSFAAFKEIAFATYGLGPSVGSKRPLTEQEQAFDPSRVVLKATGMLQFRGAFGTRPAETRIDRATTARYTKGQNHPSDARLVVPLGPLAPPDDTFLSFLDVARHYP